MIQSMTELSLLPVLLALSFTHEEANTYIYLAHHGASNVSSLARGVHTSRITMHTIITKLVKRGYVIKTKLRKRILYEVCDPELLIAEFEPISKESTQALSLLSLTIHKALFIPDIKIHSGAKEINYI